MRKQLTVHAGRLKGNPCRAVPHHHLIEAGSIGGCIVCMKSIGNAHQLLGSHSGVTAAAVLINQGFQKIWARCPVH